jgi:hypothetical protein
MPMGRYLSRDRLAIADGLLAPLAAAAALLPYPGAKPSLQARLVAITLADQAGRAFGTSSAARSGG